MFEVKFYILLAPGGVYEGGNGDADAKFFVLEQDLGNLWSLFLPSSIISVGLVEGRLNLQEALLKGRVKVQGNADAALKFSPEMLPRIPKL